ncbi:MAG: hypothetical protein ACOCYT_01025 [Chloroflexota bacterium]
MDEDTSTTQTIAVVTVEQHETICPSCGQRAVFDCIGEQHWPPHIAARLSLPEVVKVWRCGACDTTITNLV